jgi:hypothetical protein
VPTSIKIKMFHLMQLHEVGWNLEQFHTKTATWVGNARGYGKYRACNQSKLPKYSKPVEDIWPDCFEGSNPAPATPAAPTTSAPADRTHAVQIFLGERCDGVLLIVCV